MRNFAKFILFFIFLILWSTCQLPLQKWLLKLEDINFEKSLDKPTRYQYKKNCNDPISYAPDTNNLNHTIIRYLRVNIHFMNDLDSTKNFDGIEAEAFAKSLLKAAEQDLKRLNRLAIPPKNKIPALPKQYRYVLTPKPDKPTDVGVYCHYDSELFFFINKGKNRNNYKKKVIEKYAIQEDSVINIFIMPHHPDSVKSKSYNVTRTGIALKNAVKIAGIYESGNYNPNDYKGLLNHEIGHVLGLSHAWGYDGCEDTPTHPNCWNRTKESPCDTMASNNVMDYNAFQHAWTPCQIGKIHKNFTRLKSRQRKLIIQTWCELKEDYNIIIRDTIEWKAAKDIEGHIVVEENGMLKIRCRVSLPRDGKIILKPNGHLILENGWLHNSCGENWGGIEIQKRGKKKGKITFIGNPTIDDSPFLYSN